MNVASYRDFPAVRPIRHLLSDPHISEIMINGLSHLFVERGGRIEAHPPVFSNQAQLDVLVEALLTGTGRTVNAMSPFVDFRLPDGARVNVVIAPVALGGPVITIRRGVSGIDTLEELVRRGTMTVKMARFLCAAVGARINIVFSGGTGSGKTTLLGLLSAYIPENERIVVIEDTAELHFAQPHVVRLECRPPNIEGAGAINIADLLRNSLRMRPTRIILGEVRGDEAFELLAAMSSGHEGAFAVLHASSPTQALSRLGMMVLGRGLPFPLWSIQRQIASAVDLVVQHAMLPDGTRRVTQISAVQGATEDSVTVEDLFVFDQQGVDAQGRVAGQFVCTGVQPAWYARLARASRNRIDDLLVRGPA